MFFWSFGTVKEPPRESVDCVTRWRYQKYPADFTKQIAKSHYPVFPDARRWGYSNQGRRRSLASQKPDFLN